MAKTRQTANATTCTTLVEVKALTVQEPDVLTRTAETPPPVLYVQVGAFSDQHNAQRVVDRLHAGGLSSAFILAPPDGKPPLYRVRLGPIATVAEFDRMAARLTTLGFPEARLATD